MGRFEHRLFLSATLHNGHSHSFSTLLELHDPYRFTRGVEIGGKKTLDDLIVRRLKEDIRSVQGGCNVACIAIEGLAGAAPELVLSHLLAEHRTAREERFATTSRRAQAAAGLLVVGLQQRRLSSAEAFTRRLSVHSASVQRHWGTASCATPEATETTPRPPSKAKPEDNDWQQRLERPTGVTRPW